MENIQTDSKEYTEEKPPVLSSWKKLYAVVIGNLIVLVILFYLFTKSFN